MRVLFSQTTPYLPHDSGGTLTNTDTMCRLLRGRGIMAEVIASEGHRSIHHVLPWKRHPFDYPVHRSRQPLVATQRLCSENPPDLAIVQLGDLGGLSRIFIAAGIPTLVYIHDTYTFDVATLPAHSNLISFAACSSFIAQHMRKRLASDPFVIPVLVDPTLYRTVTTRRFATLINPIPRKGSEIAFVLAASRPDISFAFVEAWRLRKRVWKYMEGRAAHYGNVRLVHRTNDMRNVYGSSRVILAPSLGEEAWGRVISEAQVSGIPALASNSGGLPDAVGPGGVIVDRYAPTTKWLTALSELWDDSEHYERLVAHSYAHAGRSDFQPTAVLDKVINLFGTLTRQK